ncbi:MAG: ABC transporter permease, partial [Clostridium sp.]
NDNLLDKTIGGTSQITITSESTDKFIEDYSNIVNDIKTNNKDNITNIMGVLDNPVLVDNDGVNKSLLIRGMDYTESNDIYGISKNIIEGEFPSIENGVLIGKGISEELGLKVNDEFKIQSPGIQEKIVVVTGIVDLKVKNLNNMWVLTSVDNAGKLFGQEGKVTSVEMQIEKKYIFEADEITANIESYMPEGLKMTNWKNDNESLLDALSGQSTSSLTIQTFITISVTMSIAGVLAISVLQKSKQVGILKAMGITDKSAASIFVLQGLIFGVIGAVVGSILGISFFKLFTVVVKTADGNPLVPGNMYYGFIAMSLCISILASVIASVLAAKNSLKLDPIDIIRNN